MRLKYLATAAMFALATALAAPAHADLSKAAKATSVLDERGKPVGPSAYEDASDAIRAGDMAAYLQVLAADTENEETTETFRGLLLAIDALQHSLMLTFPHGYMLSKTILTKRYASTVRPPLACLA